LSNVDDNLIYSKLLSGITGKWTNPKLLVGKCKKKKEKQQNLVKATGYFHPEADRVPGTKDEEEKPKNYLQLMQN
jgi:hypothetical protein